jgi:hypothetical protein
MQLLYFSDNIYFVFTTRLHIYISHNIHNYHSNTLTYPPLP